MKYLIVNGDDFGASIGISRGILEAHKQGILTSTSFMVNMPASQAAADSAQATPELSVGLHADLTAEMRDPGPALKHRLAATLAAQLRRFEQLMNRPPTHLDSHHNLHRDPRARPHFLELARKLGLPLREHSPARYVSSFYGQWGGVSHLEQISVENLARLLRTELSEGVSELGCHPGYVEPDFATSYAVEREVEVRTLCAPLIRSVLQEQQIRLVSFHELATLPAAVPSTESLCPP